MQRIGLAAGAIVVATVSVASAQEAFVGRWAATQDICSSHGGDSAANSALIATDTSLSWFEGYCRIGKMYKAKAVYVQAHCGGKDLSVTLDAAGSRMRVTWGGKPADLQRCN